MIEVEDQEVILAAVNAWVFEEKFHETAQILCLIDGVVSTSRGDVRRPILLVMGAVPGLVAGATETVEKPRRAILERELTNRFDFPAAGATFLTPRAVHAIV